MILFFELVPKGEGDDVKALGFFSKFRAKLLATPFNILNSPYSKKLFYSSGSHGRIHVFLLDIAWLKFYWLGLVLLATCFFLRLSLGWFVLPGIMTLMYIFWSPWLYLFLFRQGLRKAGFKGKVKRLSSEDFCERSLLWDK